MCFRTRQTLWRGDRQRDMRGARALAGGAGLRLLARRTAQTWEAIQLLLWKMGGEELPFSALAFLPRCQTRSISRSVGIAAGGGAVGGSSPSPGTCPGHCLSDATLDPQVKIISDPGSERARGVQSSKTVPPPWGMVFSVFKTPHKP